MNNSNNDLSSLSNIYNVPNPTNEPASPPTPKLPTSASTAENISSLYGTTPISHSSNNSKDNYNQPQNIITQIPPMVQVTPTNLVSSNSQYQQNTTNQLNSSQPTPQPNSTNFNNHPPEPLNQYPNSSNQYNPDEYLIEKFVGEKYNSFKNSNFNIWALIFGNIYLVYRKMFLYGLVVGLINVFLNSLSTMATLVINIILAFFVNKIYLSFAKKKVDKIKKANINSPHNIESFCISKGGTSIGLVFLVILIEVILTIIFAILFTILNFTTKLTFSNSDFNGIISYDISTNIYDAFTINIPDNFEITSDYNALEASINTNPNELFGSCKVFFSCIDGYSSAQKFSSQMSEFYSGKNYSKKKINGITWYTFRHSLGQTEDVYITEKDNKVYIYQYTTEQDANESLCAEYNAQIINSITLK